MCVSALPDGIEGIRHMYFILVVFVSGVLGHAPHRLDCCFCVVATLMFIHGYDRVNRRHGMVWLELFWLELFACSRSVGGQVAHDRPGGCGDHFLRSRIQFHHCIQAVVTLTLRRIKKFGASWVRFHRYDMKYRRT